MFLQPVKQILWVYNKHCCVIGLPTGLFCLSAGSAERAGASNVRRCWRNIQTVELSRTPCPSYGRWVDAGGEPGRGNGSNGRAGKPLRVAVEKRRCLTWEEIRVYNQHFR